MTREIKKVTVLGAGTMGAGIAAQLANAGIEVNLLDIVPEGAEDRNVVVKGAIERMKKATNPAADPIAAAFMTPGNARFIKPGNIEDDLESAVKDCDWFIEVVPENLNLKRSIYEKVDAHLEPGTIVTSNTSTIPLHDLIESRSDMFKENFAITHFFNPPRFMKLLEMVSGEKTSAEVTSTLDKFCDDTIGRKVIHCNDTPAFIGNRIGTFFMFKAIADAQAKGINVEDADTVLSRPLELAAKSGPFKVLDLVGLQIVPGLQHELGNTLDENDPFRQIDSAASSALIDRMIEEGRTGRKSGKGGFYHVEKDAKGKKNYLSVDLQTGEYKPSAKRDLAVVNAAKAAAKTGDSPAKAVFEVMDKKPASKEEVAEEMRMLNEHIDQKKDISDEDKARHKASDAEIKAFSEGLALSSSDIELSSYAWEVMRDTLLYTASLVPEIADSVKDIDDAMIYGYDWKKGPFQILQDMGVEWFVDRARAEGCEIPPLLEIIMRDSPEHKALPFYEIIDGKEHHLNYSKGMVETKNRDGVINLKEKVRNETPLITHNGASLWDIGDGVVCLELHSLKDTMDPTVLHVINESIKLVKDNPDQYKSMVIYNDGNAFSVGANLGLIDEILKYEKKSLEDIAKEMAPAACRTIKLPLVGKIKVPAFAAKRLASATVKAAAWLDKTDETHSKFRQKQYKKARAKVSKGVYNDIEDIIYQGQSVYQALREAPFPVVGAPTGFAFGGGCELLLHCDAVQAHAETYTALVEAGVGVIPGWGGCARMLEKAFNAQAAGHLANGPIPPAQKIFEAFMNPMAAISTSAQDAKTKMWFSPNDGVTMNRERLLGDAKAKALSMVDGYEPQKQATYRLAGPTAATAFRMGVDGFYANGFATYHDAVVGDALGEILSGKDTHVGIEMTESDVKQLEREAFMSLIRTPETQARVIEMARKGGFIREKTPEGNPPLSEIRKNRTPLKLKHREVTGDVLEGKDAHKLKKSADRIGGVFVKTGLHPNREYTPG